MKTHLLLYFLPLFSFVHHLKLVVILLFEIFFIVFFFSNIKALILGRDDESKKRAQGPWWLMTAIWASRHGKWASNFQSNGSSYKPKLTDSIIVLNLFATKWPQGQQLYNRNIWLNLSLFCRVINQLIILNYFFISKA